MKKFYIYETTFVPTGQIYVGFHGSENIDSDPYIGSGLVISKLLKKHGREAFSRRIVHEFSDEQEAKLKEAEIVTEEFVRQPHVLNIAPGGQGGAGVAGCLSKEQRLENGRKAAEKLRGRSADTHDYLRKAGQKISERFHALPVEVKKQRLEKRQAWTKDAEKLQRSIDKRVEKMSGRTKQNHPGRASQADKVSGLGNGSSRQAQARVAVLKDVNLRQLPPNLFARRYDIEHQLEAISHLVQGGLTQNEAAQIARMPISSFNLVVANLVKFVRTAINKLH